MPHTYKAKLRNDRIIWISKIPDKIKNKEQEVYITFSENQPVRQIKRKKSLKIAALLEELAQANTNPSIKDPVEWQKDIREDRKLAGRD